MTRAFVLPKTETLILKIIIGVTCLGVAVGVILLGWTLPLMGKYNKTLMCVLPQLFTKSGLWAVNQYESLCPVLIILIMTLCFSQSLLFLRQMFSQKVK